MNDPVNHPVHYRAPGLPECVEVIEGLGLGYHEGNALKYIWRAGRKPGADRATDLRKAAWFLNRAAELSDAASRPIPTGAPVLVDWPARPEDAAPVALPVEVVDALKALREDEWLGVAANLEDWARKVIDDVNAVAGADPATPGPLTLIGQGNRLVRRIGDLIGLARRDDQAPAWVGAADHWEAQAVTWAEGGTVPTLGDLDGLMVLGLNLIDGADWSRSPEGATVAARAAGLTRDVLAWRVARPNVEQAAAVARRRDLFAAEVLITVEDLDAVIDQAKGEG